MYCLVEYEDFRREQCVKFLGSSTNFNKLMARAESILNEMIDKWGYDQIIKTSDFDSLKKYPWLKPKKFIESSDMGEIIVELGLVKLARYPKPALEKLIDKHSDKTIEQFIFDCCGKSKIPKYHSIQSQLVKDQSFDTIEEILDYLAIEYADDCAFGPTVDEYSPQMFAIVKVLDIES